MVWVGGHPLCTCISKTRWRRNKAASDAQNRDGGVGYSWSAHGTARVDRLKPRQGLRTRIMGEAPPILTPFGRVWLIDCGLKALRIESVTAASRFL